MQAEDAVCLADYCDIMRCEVLHRQSDKDSSATNGESLQLYRGKNGPITDLEVWREPTQRNALSIVPKTAKSSTLNAQEINSKAQLVYSCDKYVNTCYFNSFNVM